MKKGIFREFIRYVSLSTLGILGVTCYILADTFFIARGMGSAGITALNLALPMFNLIFAVGVLLGLGGATRYTVLQAQKRPEEADGVYSMVLAAGMVIGVIFLLGGVLFAGPIAGTLGADPEVFDLTEGYLRTISWFAPAFIVNQILSVFVRNDEAPRLAMIANLASSLFNIVFDYIFIFPMGLGMFGAALATGVSPMISMFLLSLHFLRKKNRMHLVRRALPWKRLGRVCALGISGFINEISGGLVIITFNYAFLRISGNLGVAAYGIVANLAIVVTCLFNGVAQGMQPLVSDCSGRGQEEEKRRLLCYGLAACLVLAGIVYLAAWRYTDVLVALFNGEKDPELARLAGEGLRIYFAGFFFAAVNVVMTSYDSAAERPWPAFVVSAIRGFAVIIPAILILSRIGGMTGTWLAYAFAEAVGMLAGCGMALVRRHRSCQRKGNLV